MRINKCQHCGYNFNVTGDAIETVCPYCADIGHSQFKADCPVCNRPNPSQIRDSRITIKPPPPKAA